jgi:hypothetical protein
MATSYTLLYINLYVMDYWKNAVDLYGQSNERNVMKPFHLIIEVISVIVQ